MSEGFGFNNAWLAVRDRSPEALAQALSLSDVRVCGWETGLASAYHYPAGTAVFLPPPVHGWAFCVGLPLAAWVDRRPPVFHTCATELAERLQTEVQFFSTDRVVDTHAWARAFPAGPRRAFAYSGASGKKLVDEGRITDVERGLVMLDPVVGADLEEIDVEAYCERYFAERKPGVLGPVTEGHVITVAAGWSLDPTPSWGEVDHGWIGELVEPPPRPSARGMFRIPRLW